MTLYFRTFRGALSITMLLVSAATILLAFIMLSSFSRNAIPWLLVGVQILSFMRTLWSKSLLNSPQSVASEAIGLFSLFPFHLILALIVVTTEFKERGPPVIYFLLQISVIGGSAIHIVYTICLILTAMITVSAFDADVWIRDIDSTPSPFPMSIIFEFLRFRTLDWYRRNQSWAIQDETPQQTHICVPPCACPVKPSPVLLYPEDSELHNDEEHLKGIKSLPHALVRVPNAAERRASIAVSFEVAS